MGRSPEAMARRRAKARERAAKLEAGEAERTAIPQPPPVPEPEPVLPEPQPVPAPVAWTEPEPEAVPVVPDRPAARTSIYCCRGCLAELPDARTAQRWGGFCWACRPPDARGHRAWRAGRQW